MSANRKFGLIISIVLFTLTCFVAWIYQRYLPNHRWMAGCVFLVGTGGAFLTGWLIAEKLTDSRRARVSAVCFIGAFVLIPLLSMFAIGRVTASAFGYTMYGLVPIPALDFTVGPHGGLWFREKTHRIHMGEIEPLLGDDTEIIIIGTGWHEVAKVDDDVRALEGVRVLSTPEAFALFNKLVAAGKRVVMLAHSTC